GRGSPDVHRHHLPLLRRGVHAVVARAGQPHREGTLTARQLRHPREPLHQGPLRLATRPRLIPPRDRPPGPSTAPIAELTVLLHLLPVLAVVRCAARNEPRRERKGGKGEGWAGA